MFDVVLAGVVWLFCFHQQEFELLKSKLGRDWNSYNENQGCNLTDTSLVNTHGAVVAIPDLVVFEEFYKWLSIITMMIMLIKVALQEWFPSSILNTVIRSMRRAVRKSIIFMIMVSLVVVLLSAASTFIYSTHEDFMSLQSSISSIGTLLIGNIDNFRPVSADPWLDDFVYVGYTYLVVCTFSEFFIEFILQGRNEVKKEREYNSYNDGGICDDSGRNGSKQKNEEKFGLEEEKNSQSITDELTQNNTEVNDRKLHRNGNSTLKELLYPKGKLATDGNVRDDETSSERNILVPNK